MCTGAIYVFYRSQDPLGLIDVHTYVGNIDELQDSVSMN